MKLSIIIPAFNEEKLLPATLDAVRSAASVFTEAGVAWECIVCDNNSTDRTAELARERGVTVVFEPVNQISRARNAGASVATGDWLLFIDADSRPSRELLADALTVMRDGRFLFAGSTVTLDGDLPKGTRMAVGGWNGLSRLLNWMAGSFVLVETSAFREVDGFSRQFFAGEEVDLSRRLKRLARRRGKRGVILARHPLVTSARRLKLYTAWELGRFFVRATLRPWSTTASREACGMWYDGKR
jgi:glycosyltransferase involved in cell wall biosynthesis